MNKPISKNKGFIQFIILVVIFVLILSYFQIDIQGFIDKPIVQKNLDTLWNWGIWLWDNILQVPTLYVWNFLATYVFKKAEMQIGG